ncbi:hypothetical protein KDH_59690 [Dictyobacter sp. S3.2.2.5]|uniref:Uncharacterized protein n=1 Tax=Dictyobacter halimunensis TaxID=3026934 RepID=A0ABQ6G0U2_9CHLR|nr:hypothetical protein KDH_59690 [Dictyobacter sp. S3.2.2.5]
MHQERSTVHDIEVRQERSTADDREVHQGRACAPLVHLSIIKCGRVADAYAGALTLTKKEAPRQGAPLLTPRIARIPNV